MRVSHEVLREWQWRITRGLICACAALALFNMPPEFLSIDTWLTHWRSALFSPAPASQEKDISVVAISPDSLSSLPYTSPIDRAYLSQLVQQIAAQKPRMIMLDFIFDRPTEFAKDEQLIATLRKLDVPVVLGYGDSRSGLSESAKAYQADFLKRTGRNFGYVNLTTTVSQNEVTHIPEESDPGVCAFSDMVVDGLCHGPSKEARRIEWLLPAKDGHEVFAVIPASQVTMQPEALTGRVVVIGGFFPSIDLYKTPISRVQDNPLGSPGVLIHAQSMQQVLDKRHLDEMSPILAVTLILVCGVIGTLFSDVKELDESAEFIFLLTHVSFITLDIMLFKYWHVLFNGDELLFTMNFSIFLNWAWKRAHEHVLKVISRRKKANDGDHVKASRVDEISKPQPSHLEKE